MKNGKYSMNKFLFIWSGQFLSVLGSAISGFGLSVWLFEQTGAATPFAISFLCSILPSLLLSPLAGSLADRKNRKTIIVLTDSIDAILKVVAVVLLYTNSIKVWMVYPFMALSSTLGTFQSPAFSASIPMIVDEEHLSRANGMRQLSGAAQNMLAPIFAGILYPMLHLKGLLIVDLCSYVFAFTTIILTKIPQPKLEEAETTAKKLLSTAIKDFKTSIMHLYSIRPLFTVFMVFAAANFVLNMSIILQTPLILSTYDSTILGISQSVSGIAMIAGAVIASVSPNPKNPYVKMYGLLIISGVGLMIAGVSPHWAVIFVGIFTYCISIPYVNTLSETLLQKNIEKQLLGRVGSAVSVLCQMAMPISALLSGVLADNVFNPLMMENGALAKTFIGSIIGVGNGRGIGLLFIINGIIMTCLAIVYFVKSKKLIVQNELEQPINDDVEIDAENADENTTQN